MQGGESGLSEGAGRPVRALLPEVSGAEPSRAEQRREGARDQLQGARHGAAEEGEPGECQLGYFFFFKRKTNSPRHSCSDISTSLTGRT